MTSVPHIDSPKGYIDKVPRIFKPVYLFFYWKCEMLHAWVCKYIYGYLDSEH